MSTIRWEGSCTGSLSLKLPPFGRAQGDIMSLVLARIPSLRHDVTKRATQAWETTDRSLGTDDRWRKSRWCDVIDGSVQCYCPAHNSCPELGIYLNVCHPLVTGVCCWIWETARIAFTAVCFLCNCRQWQTQVNIPIIIWNLKKRTNESILNDIIISNHVSFTFLLLRKLVCLWMLRIESCFEITAEVQSPKNDPNPRLRYSHSHEGLSNCTEDVLIHLHQYYKNESFVSVHVKMVILLFLFCGIR